ncbi:MAG TPA: 23S rRNA (adenine(2503)-C(2))-methyltransferase RlmN [Polyangia bacterium]|jgi:23S rRNA (adenine2503-C2)-methyltransferase|nr:23S rRNA (adenine(2503)-C(2))-methyltransferase RlmN [Polyangia bacterium]
MDLDLRSLTPAELTAELGTDAPAYRGEQLFRWLHEHGVEGIDEMTNVPQAQREALSARLPLRPLRADVVQEARDGTRKLRFRTFDDRAIESVLIPDDDAERDKLTLCVSSQVGCAMDCGFCATATLGYGRNLSAGEIVEQVYRATTLAGRRPTNLVFMGMGEPLHNLDNVTRALTLLEHPWGLHFSPRRITVSTAGLVPGIEKLGRLSPAPNLAISLNATTDEVRDRIMPVNRKWPIAKLLEAARRFPLAHGRRVTFEYVLLAGVNDSDADADRLVLLLRGMPCKVNLIPWNAFNKIGNPARVPDAPPATGSAGQGPSAPTRSGPQFERPSAERIRTFQQRLRAANMAVYIRTPRGEDIDAACGQLAARDEAGLVPTSRLERPAEAV